MSIAVYQWQIYCETESAWVSGYHTDEISTCPHNTAHGVTAGSAQKLAEYGSSSVKIIEYEHSASQKAIAGYRQLITVDIRDDANDECDLSLAGNTTSKMVWTSPPDPIVIYSIKSNVSAYQKGDVINLWVSKDTPIGTTTAVTASGSYSFVASTSPVRVVDLVYTGMEISLYDGGAPVVLGRITALNSATNTVTCQYAASRELASGSAVLLSVRTVNNAKIGNAGPYNFGDDLPSALGYIAPSTPVTIWYQNNHPRPLCWSVDLTIGYGAK
jgi:hypothetical protein